MAVNNNFLALVTYNFENGDIDISEGSESTAKRISDAVSQGEPLKVTIMRQQYSNSEQNHAVETTFNLTLKNGKFVEDSSIMTKAAQTLEKLLLNQSYNASIISAFLSKINEGKKSDLSSFADSEWVITQKGEDKSHPSETKQASAQASISSQDVTPILATPKATNHESYSSYENVTKLESIKQFIQPIPDTVIIFDLDDTLISDDVKAEYQTKSKLTLEDALVATHKTTTIPNIPMYLAELRAKLPDGGKIVLMTNSLESSMNRKLQAIGLEKKLFDFIDTKDEVLARTQTEKATNKGLRLENLCQKHGLKPKQICIVDDEKQHLDSVRKSSQKLKVPTFVSVQYSGACLMQHRAAAITHCYDDRMVGKSLDYYLNWNYTKSDYSRDVKAQKDQYDSAIY
ncbi:HAD family hydrolase [Parashewanella spongiae]|uniref:HAD family hydrolase n=1 Tax=Parashewanella spongiae TaxID=342950 RepID=A0A3A6UK36_9GAMM|nr:HAD-IIIC family phosphatase [Parashewanella spongiae]MCL1076629.1 DUF2608 domain-containing protein [Parashewanella spongiae]RJY19582.1 HAD family hydrolase [Parashewanella spongiae]